MTPELSVFTTRPKRGSADRTQRSHSENREADPASKEDGVPGPADCRSSRSFVYPLTHQESRSRFATGLTVLSLCPSPPGGAYLGPRTQLVSGRRASAA